HTRSKRDWSSDVCSSDLDLTQHAVELDVQVGVAHELVSLDGHAHVPTDAAEDLDLLGRRPLGGTRRHERLDRLADLGDLDGLLEIGRASCREWQACCGRV